MNTKHMLTVIVEKTDTGFSAYAQQIAGLTTVGDTLSEIKANFAEILADHVAYLNEMGDPSAHTAHYQIEYVIDLKQLFDYLKVINKSIFAEKYVAMNPSLFRQYTSGLTHFSSDKIAKISEGLHKLADELNDLTLV